MGITDDFDGADVHTESPLAAKKNHSQKARIDAVIAEYDLLWGKHCAQSFEENAYFSSHLSLKNGVIVRSEVYKDDLQGIVDQLSQRSAPEECLAGGECGGQREYSLCISAFVTQLIQKCYNAGENDFSLDLPELSQVDDATHCSFANSLKGTHDNPIRISVSSDASLTMLAERSQYIDLTLHAQVYFGAKGCMHSRFSFYKEAQQIGSLTQESELRFFDNAHIVRGQRQCKLEFHKSGTHIGRGTNCEYWVYGSTDSTMLAAGEYNKVYATNVAELKKLDLIDPTSELYLIENSTPRRWPQWKHEAGSTLAHKIRNFVVWGEY